MTSIKTYSSKKTQAKISSLSWVISLGLSLGLLGCSSPFSLSSTEPLGHQLSMADAPSPVNNTSELEPERSSLAQQLPITATITINGNVINLEVAQTRSQQAIGLMYRTSLNDDHGMLFPFSPPRPVNFWMRNVEINLDMLFIQDGRVLAIESQVPPCRTELCPHYGPVGVPIDYVLELRGGRASELGVEIGDPMIITDLPNPL